VNRQPGLLRQGHHQREIGRRERQAVRRIGHGEDADRPILKPDRRGDDGLDDQRRIIVFDDPWVGTASAIRTPSPVRATCPTTPSLRSNTSDFKTCSIKRARVVSLAFACGGRGRCGGTGPRPPRPASCVGSFLKDAGAQRPGAQDGGVDNALKQILARQAFTQRLHHVMHEIHHELLFLGQDQLLLSLRSARARACTPSQKRASAPDAAPNRKRTWQDSWTSGRRVEFQNRRPKPAATSDRRDCARPPARPGTCPDSWIGRHEILVRLQNQTAPSSSPSSRLPSKARSPDRTPSGNRLHRPSATDAAQGCATTPDCAAHPAEHQTAWRSLPAHSTRRRRARRGTCCPCSRSRQNPKRTASCLADHLDKKLCNDALFATHARPWMRTITGSQYASTR